MVGRSQSFATVPCSKEAIYNPLDLPSETSPFLRIEDSQMFHAVMWGGAAHSKKLGVEQHYFRNLASMS